MSKLAYQHQLLKESVELALKGISNFEGLAADILTKVVIETIHKYQQKLNVGVQDSVSDLLDTFKQKVTEAIFAKAGAWKVANREPFLFPRGCRFCFTRGNAAIFVIEQEPQIRSLLFDAYMLGKEHTATESNTTAERISLALPYVVFLVHFKDNAFRNLYCGWRTAPLRSLDDYLCQPLLPNIHDGGNVCLGSSWTRSTEASMASQSESVIGYFWNSQFNNDLSTNWWNKRNIDLRLESAREWNNWTVGDETFILDVHFNEDRSRSLQRRLEQLTTEEQEPDENAFRQDLAESIDQCVEGLSSKILRYFKKTKFDRHHPKDVTDSLTAAMREANVELVDLMFAIQHELQRLETEVKESRDKSRLVPCGSLWGEYSP